MELDMDRIEREVIDQAAEQIARQAMGRGDLASRVETLLEDRLVAMCDEVVMPIIDEGLDRVILAKTNEYGESKGEDTTLREWIVKTATDWLLELVDHRGSTRNSSSRNYGNNQTRLAYLVDEGLRHRIKLKMKEAMKLVIDNTGEAIAETVKVQINSVVRGVKAGL